MDTAVAVAKLGTIWMTTVMMVVGVMMSYTGGLEARSATRTAARAASAALAADWNCTETGGAWTAAVDAAAAATGDRLRGNDRLVVIDFGLSADTATCTVLAVLVVQPITHRWWAGPIHAVSCAPTRAGVGFGLATPCGQGP